MSEAPSTAMNPDLDWSQVRETVRMLHAAIAQIKLSMTEGEDSVEHLTDTFTTMVGRTTSIGEAAKQLPDGPEKATIQQNIHAVHDEVQSAIVAFQFYDKLTQRLEHAAHSLKALGGLVGDQSRLYSPYEWKGLQDAIQSRYNIESDRAMFKAILEGATVEEALKLMQALAAEEPEHDIELF